MPTWIIYFCGLGVLRSVYMYLTYLGGLHVAIDIMFSLILKQLDKIGGVHER